MQWAAINHPIREYWQVELSQITNSYIGVYGKGFRAHYGELFAPHYVNKGLGCDYEVVL